MQRRTGFCGGFLLAIVMGSAGVAIGDGPAQLAENETAIKCPETMMVFAISAHSDRIAFVARVKGSTKKTVDVEDAVGKAYDDIRPLGGKQSVLFSEDSKHYAYAARSGKSWCVVLDDKEGAAMESVEDPVLSPDGLSVAYGGVKDGKPVLVVDGAGAGVRNLEGMDAGGKIADRLTVSADLKHWAYVAGAEGAADRAVMVDGKSVGNFASATKPLFTADGLHWGFLGTTNKADRTTEGWAVVDGKKYGPYENLSGLVFSADSKHFAAIRGSSGGGGPVMPGTKVDKAAVLRDGKLEGDFEAIENPLVYSGDSQRLAYVADVGNGQCCVVDGKAGQTAQRIHPPLFSPDSVHVAYAIETKDGVGVVVDGKPGPAFRDIANESAIVFSPDSKHTAFLGVGGDGKRVMVMDAKPVGPPTTAAPLLCFTPDSAHLVSQDTRQITVDGVPLTKPFNNASALFFTAPTKFQTIIGIKEKSKRTVSENFYRLEVEIH